MSLQQQLVDELKQADTSQGAATVTVTEADGTTATATVADSDRYSVTIDKLTVATPTSDNGPSLADAAQNVIDNVTYLDETFALVELDEEEGVAQLRSETPDTDGDTINYWEAVINDKAQPQADLTRYEWSPNQADRQPVAHPLTHKTVGRLAKDLADSLTSKQGA